MSDKEITYYKLEEIINYFPDDIIFKIYENIKKIELIQKIDKLYIIGEDEKFYYKTELKINFKNYKKILKIINNYRSIEIEIEQNDFNVLKQLFIVFFFIFIIIGYAYLLRLFYDTCSI